MPFILLFFALFNGEGIGAFGAFSSIFAFPFRKPQNGLASGTFDVYMSLSVLDPSLLKLKEGGDCAVILHKYGVFLSPFRDIL